MANVRRQQSANVKKVSLTDADLNAYLAELSHELKNLLNCVALVLQLAGTKQQRPSLDQGQRHIQAQGKEVVLLVDSSRDLAQLSQGNAQFREDRTNLLESVTEAVVQAREIAEPSGIQVSYQFRQDSLFVSVTKQRLTRILFSLLLERIDHVQNEGWIEVIVERDGPEAIVRIVSPIMNTGKETDDILQWPDRQLDDGKLHKRLRTPIARALVQWHGGDISLKANEPGKSELAIRLPVVPNAAEAEPGSPNTARKNLQVLVVDDNVDSARTVATYLRLSGHRVDTRHDGRAALDAAREQHPDVLVLDLGLPKLDGYEVAEQLRENVEFRNTRLIAVSGYGHDEALERSRLVGFDYHLVKPVDNNELLSLVERG